MGTKFYGEMPISNKETPGGAFVTNNVPNNNSFIHDKTPDDSEYYSTNYLDIPEWDISEFIKERIRFRSQGLDTPNKSLSRDTFQEPGNFFYKIFFNFSTGYGLLGSLVKTPTSKYIKDYNSAWQYLTNNIYGDKFSENYKRVLLRKRENLVKFGRLLNFLTHNCPWFFKDVGGLSEATRYNFNEISTVDGRIITISFNKDAVDMRISTLLDLYRDACFDYTNYKEVIPENLRKFDMSIIVFNPPTYGLNILYQNNKYSYTKTKMNIDDETSKTSGFTFKCLIFKNCEIKYQDLSTFADAIDNEDGFSIEHQLTIGFDRVYSYNINNELNAETLDGLFRDSDDVINSGSYDKGWAGDDISSNSSEKYKAALDAQDKDNKDAEARDKANVAEEAKDEAERKKRQAEIKAAEAKAKKEQGGS